MRNGDKKEIAQPLDILNRYWAYPAFRPLQAEIIQAVLDQKDSLVLMPTGGGKSICYQIPALCKPGICIVVSPLIALMKDQVLNLKKRQIPAVAIYSGMHYREIDRILDNCIYGKTKFLYLSPERLTSDLVRERIRKMNVNLLAVDEAHCISQWGYDFRPPYLEIAAIRDLIPETPVLALTATATPQVVEDIQQHLKFAVHNVFQKSFGRSNLSYSVLPEEAKQERLFKMLQKVKGSAIVYVRSRIKTKNIALYLKQKGISADFYHAGLDPVIRNKKQEAWMNNQCRVVVSTNAFGMGIDKPDVRLVVHLDLPDSLEAYYQEAGRAGRDGQKSFAVLLYNLADKDRLLKQYELSYPTFEEIKQVYRALGSFFQLAAGGGMGASFDFDLRVFCNNFNLDPVKAFHGLRNLEKEGWIALSESIYIPSSVQFITTKDQLYDFQLKQPKLDKLVKTLLRTTQGAFQNPVFINENQISDFLKTSVDEVKRQLTLLQAQGMVKYLPKKDNPQITFLRERVPTENLTIDNAAYQLRKKHQYEKLQKAIEYAEQPICRSQQLLAYFGETESTPCGICDVCLGRTQKHFDENAYQHLKPKIQLLLRQESLNLEHIVESFAPKWKHQVLKTMEYLVDEGYVKQQEDLTFTWNA